MSSKWGWLCLCLMIFSASAAQPQWQSRFVNPKPLEDDVLLPMPCGGQMVFRPVVVPSSGPLDDQAVVLGGDAEGAQSLEHNRTAFIAGSFAAANQARYYLVAKYELNQLQYRSVMEETCPKPSTRLALPAVNLNWHDAVDFAQRYNLWLLTHAKDAVPHEESEPGFVRLPTEAEWEFALRGGKAVTSSEFREPKFPMTGALSQYAWYSSPQSANGRLQLMGLLKPNPLGLHDMLGNAAEIVLEPFRLNKLDRLHGQAGGFTVRGGSYLTARENIRSSYRQEVPYYQGSQLRRSRATGMRLVLVAPVLTSRQRIDLVQQAWQQLGQSEPADQDPDQQDALDQLGELGKTLKDDESKRQIKSLTEELKITNQLRNEQRDRAALSAIQLGAFLCSQINQIGQLADYSKRSAERICTSLPARCEAAKDKQRHHDKQLRFYARYYADTVVDTVFNYPYKVIEQQSGKLRQGLGVSQKSNLVFYADWHQQHLQQHAESERITLNNWIKDCKTTWPGAG